MNSIALEAEGNDINKVPSALRDDMRYERMRYDVNT